jgi:hypothetical protein
VAITIFLRHLKQLLWSCSPRQVENMDKVSLFARDIVTLSEVGTSSYLVFNKY